MISDFNQIPGTSFGVAEIDHMMEIAQAACMMPEPAAKPKSLSNEREEAIQATFQRAADYRR